MNREEKKKNTSFFIMPPRKMCSRMEHVRSFRSNEPQRNQPDRSQIDSLRFAFSIIVNGCSFTDGESIFLWNNLLPPSQSSFYRAQKVVSEKIIEMATESCRYWKNKLLPNSCIAFDGSWSHRRNAMHCLIDFIDTRTKKVVDFEVVSKMDSDFNGSSNSMECFGLRKMIPRWIDNKKVTHYVHDNDAKSRKLIRELGWNVEENIDLNHYMKSYRRKFDKYKELSPTKFRGIKLKLERFFQSLMHLDATEEDKIDLWMNVVEHFSGNHTSCIKHKPTRIWSGILIDGNKEALTTFLKKASKLLTKCNTAHSTQMCESLHAIKAHFANKLICWKSSWTCRICAAILDFNSPHWEFQLYNELQLPPLAPIISQKLRKISQQKIDQRIKRSSEEYKIKDRKRKRDKRIQNKDDDKDCSYRGNKKVISTKKSSQKDPIKRKYHLTKMPKQLGSFNKWFEKFGFDGSQKDDENDSTYSFSDDSNDDCCINDYRRFLQSKDYHNEDIEKDYELMISDEHQNENVIEVHTPDEENISDEDVSYESQFSNDDSSSEEEMLEEEEEVEVFDCCNLYEINGEDEDDN